MMKKEALTSILTLLCVVLSLCLKATYGVAFRDSILVIILFILGSLHYDLYYMNKED